MAKAKMMVNFEPLITGITPVFRPSEVADKAYAKGDPITIIHTFIVQGHHFGQVNPGDVEIGNFTDGYRWNVLDAATLDPCHILVHATVTCLKRKTALGATGAGSGDLTVTVNSPPPPPPPPPPGVPAKKKVTKAPAPMAAKRVEYAFTVFYMDT